jgi:uncharacterized lipoprotein YddW (UPF0748 family)
MPIFFCLALVLALFSCAKADIPQESSYFVNEDSFPKESPAVLPQAPAQNLFDFKAVWISYLEYETLLKGKDEDGARAAIDEAFAEIKALGLNAVIVHVRPFSDALYRSELFPWSHVLTGAQGADPGYDPLELMAEAAERHSLEIHAWINPYRIKIYDRPPALVSGTVVSEWSEENDGKIWSDNDGIYFNPSRQEVRDLISGGVKEIISNYDVDGIQFDDYFYPPNASDFDGQDYQDYQNSGGSLSLEDWRIENINALIREVYAAVKAENPALVFGISPQGAIESNYAHQYADVITWIKKPGYIDYIMPQVYYGFKNESHPFEKTVAQWRELTAGSPVRLYIGLAAYKIALEDDWAGSGSTEWLDYGNIIARQIEEAQAQGAQGFALYRYDSVFKPEEEVREAVTQEIASMLMG